jgi:lambda repressor-like predicted transcriptional regulator
MHPADISAALRKAGSSQAQVARWFAEQGHKPVTHAAVHMVVSGRGSSARIARRISEVTRLPVAVLWPGKYASIAAEQAPAPRSKRANSSANAANSRHGIAKTLQP